LKIVMALFVIGIHVNPAAALGPEMSILLGGGLFRVAVPAFFVINGYFFEPVMQAGGTRRFVTRIGALFVVWTALYLPAWYGVIFNPEPWALISYLVMGWWQLWYLPGLALAALLAAWMRDWPVSRVVPLMGFLFLTGVGITYAMAYDLLHPPKSYFTDRAVLHRNGLFTGFPFLMAGVLIRRHDLDRRFSVKALAGASAVALLMVMAESFSLVALAPKGVGHDNMLTLALASPALVLLALKFPYQSSGRILGTYANGLFLIHVAFVVIGLRHTDLSKFGIYSMAVAGSLAVTWVLIRVGLARRVL